MNNLRLLAGLLCASLLSGGVRSNCQSVITLEEIFESAEANSAQLRPSLTAISEADQEIKTARTAKLPDINASLNLSYLGDGFITKRDFSGYEKAPIPHLGTGLSVTVSQPLYTGGTITNSIKLAELKSTASRFAGDLQRDNIRFQLAGFYLDIYKCANLRQVLESNYRTTVTRYSEGMALITDMLDAADSRLNAGQQLVNARINIIYYYYKLLFTTGKI